MITCPCGGESRVTDSRMCAEGLARRRHRRCAGCGARTVTFEIEVDADGILLRRTPSSSLEIRRMAPVSVRLYAEVDP